MPLEYLPSQDVGLNKIAYFRPYDLINAKSFSGRCLLKGLLILQKVFRIRRGTQGLPELFEGSSWWTLSQACLSHVVRYTEENPYFAQRLKHTYCPDEVYFSTVIMNSPFKSRVTNNNLRYIDWTDRNGNCPANLDETDYDKLLASDAFFARKFEYPGAEKLVQLLESKCAQSHAGQP